MTGQKYYFLSVSCHGTFLFRTDATDDSRRFEVTKDALCKNLKEEDGYNVTMITSESVQTHLNLTKRK